MSPLVEWALAFRRGFPRVSGDEPLPVYAPFFRRAFSPRERG